MIHLEKTKRAHVRVKEPQSRLHHPLACPPAPAFIGASNRKDWAERPRQDDRARPKKEERARDEKGPKRTPKRAPKHVPERLPEHLVTNYHH